MFVQIYVPDNDPKPKIESEGLKSRIITSSLSCEENDVSIIPTNDKEIYLIVYSADKKTLKKAKKKLSKFSTGPVIGVHSI